MDGYKEAEKLDGLINKLVEKHPITKDNASSWLQFTRTVRSELRILWIEAFDVKRKN